MSEHSPEIKSVDPEQVMQWDRQYFMQFYAHVRKPVVFVRGEGVRLYDARGKRYLDFLGGFAVASFGHCHPRITEAVCNQVRALGHVSNIFHTEPQGRLAKMLAERSGMDRVFFQNSGAEANEAAIKIVRKWGKKKLGPDASEIVTALKSFHGRTFVAIAATGQPKIREGFSPDMPGFTHVPFNDIAALEAAITPNTCAVMLEPIQCEGGVYVAAQEYMRGVRSLCDRKGIALVLDEVQTGMGRTGKIFAFEHYGIKPDVMTLAKALSGGSGVPIGAVLANEEFASALSAGDHGTTFGGGPVACAAGIASLEVLEEEDLLTNCTAMGSYMRDGLQALCEKHPIVKEIRGMGLMWGVELESPKAKEINDRALELGLIVNAIGDRILRIAPPLIVTDGDLDEALDILDTVFAEFERE